MKKSQTKKILLAIILCGFAKLPASAADTEGERIYVPNNTATEIIDERFTNLSDDSLTTSNGGAIHNSGTITKISNSKFTGNFIFSESVKVYGGAIYNYGTINSIEDSSFSGNHVDAMMTGDNDVAYGGAISNKQTINSIINCSFSGNYAEGTRDNSYSNVAYGGAIYNEGTINSITGSTFEGNYAESTKDGKRSDVAYGGAIYNSGEIISIRNSTFSGNHVNGANETSGTAYGGAISNSGTITNITDSSFIENTATNGGAIHNDKGEIGSIVNTTFDSNVASSGGGAIRNSGTIGSIKDSLFTENEASVNGGAIRNDGGTINEICNSTFERNVANGSTDGGGAIYNGSLSEIESISKSTFTGNEATSGGAIYNSTSSSKIDSISESTFAGNSATGNGGATYNYGIISEISESYFTGNEAENGGGIYNSREIDSISGTVFEGNSATGNGGAIYNTNTITAITNTSFYNNSASGNGGAIYSTKDSTIVADGADVVFSGNSADGSGDAIYMASSSGTIYFELSNGGSIYLYDSVSGESGYSVDVSGDGTFYLLNDLEGAIFSIGNAVSPLAASGSGTLTLSTVDGKIRDYSMSSFALTSDINMAVDVDLASGTMDSFSADEYSFGDDDGFSITITGINLISEGSGGIGSDTQIYFLNSDSPLNGHVTIAGSAAMAYTPMYQYAVSTGTDNGGLYFTLLKDGYNPTVMASSMAMGAAYGAMNLILNANFEHSDYFMKLPEEVRLAKAEAAKAQKSASKIKENDPRRLAYYNQNEMTERGAWFKSFYANESVSYRGGWDSRDKYYGGLVGFDSDLRDHGNGWAHLFTGYVGTIGIRQEYSGGHIKQHGGLIGVTGSFYRKNFYTAWTAAAGFTKAHEHTMYGHDTSKNDTWGIAGKFGWNFELAGGKYSILPTFTASYTTVNPEDYTNAADVKFTGSGVRAVQLNPNVKFIMNAENGLQPYVTVGEVWTVGQSSGIKANGEKLPELEMKSYTEYGLGVQKRWTNEKDAYVQLLGHSHGRDGFLVNAGLRWNF